MSLCEGWKKEWVRLTTIEMYIHGGSCSVLVLLFPCAIPA